jgi:hypothetical protein
MASLGLQMSRAIDGCLLGQPTTFCLSLILQAIYDTPSIVGGTHGAPSMLRVNDDMRTIRRREEYDRDHGFPA